MIACFVYASTRLLPCYFDVLVYLLAYGRVKLVNIIIIGDFFCQGSNGWDVVNCFIIMTLFLAVYL